MAEKPTVDFVEAIPDLNKGVYNRRTALVVETKTQLGLARAYQILSENLPFEVRIFEELEEARAWVSDQG